MKMQTMKEKNITAEEGGRKNTSVRLFETACFGIVGRYEKASGFGEGGYISE